MQVEPTTEDDPFTFNQMVESMTDFLEVAFHYILYLRGIYPRETFTKKKMYGVPVWQNRHPVVKGYIAGLLQSVTREMKRGILERIIFIIKSATTNQPLERFIFDVAYMDLSKFPTEQDKDTSVLLNAPGQRRMKLLFQAFLTRLAACETGMADNDPDENLTYAVVVTCKEGEEPDTRPVVDYTSYDGNARTTEKQPVYHPPEGPSPWAPALASDGAHPTLLDPLPPPGHNGREGDTAKKSAYMGGAETMTKGPASREVVRPIRAVETGIVDINLVVQETVEKFSRVSVGSSVEKTDW
ncbi:hypothetical protein NCC49_002290 [Naganishia albida]|nr:hypothetical protein NCC49_002290 [Naganishia albida]